MHRPPRDFKLHTPTFNRGEKLPEVRRSRDRANKARPVYRHNPLSSEISRILSRIPSSKTDHFREVEVGFASKDGSRGQRRDEQDVAPIRVRRAPKSGIKTYGRS